MCTSGDQLLLPSALTWGARGTLGPRDARQHCVHSCGGQLHVSICRKGRVACVPRGRAGGARGLELSPPEPGRAASTLLGLTASTAPLAQRSSLMCSQLCPTLCDRIDWGLPGSCVHGILQASVLEWVAISFSRRSSRSRDRKPDSCIAVFTDEPSTQRPNQRMGEALRALFKVQTSS